MCPCGKRGHLEAFASAKSLVAMARERIDAGTAAGLAQAVADGVELNPELIWKLAKTGDIASLELIDTVARWLGIGITTLLHTLDPAIILLGGAMTFGGESDPIGGRFLERIRAEVRERAFPLLAERTPIRFATLGGDAGYVGTAGMARAEHLRLHPSNA
jgi:glucokinase